jgi:hypothetical protein
MRETIELYICESAYVSLHVNQPYIFRVHPICEECNRLAAFTPTINVSVDQDPFGDSYENSEANGVPGFAGDPRDTA